MDLGRLRDETRPEHEATEAAMPLMEPGLTLGAYISVLRTLLPILQSWEAWAGEHAPIPLRPLLTARRRSHLIEEDLRNLGEAVSKTPQGTGLVDWANVITPRQSGRLPQDEGSSGAFEAAFLGALYVLEGSTLGGRMIARHLQSLFAFEDAKGNAYFRGHGDRTGVLWKETTAAIAALPDIYSRELIEAARRTFDVFRSALGDTQHPRSPSELAHG